MLGDMLELGEDSVKEHVSIVQKALELGLDHLCLVGTEFAKAMKEICCQSGEVVLFDTSAQLAEWVEKSGLGGCTILIKGSRGTRMEKVVEKL